MISFHTGTILPRVDLCVCVDCVRLERLNVLAVFSTTIILILAGLNQIKLWYASLSLSLITSGGPLTSGGEPAVFHCSSERLFDPPQVSTLAISPLPSSFCAF